MHARLRAQVMRQINALQQASAELRKLESFVRSSRPPALEVAELQVRTMGLHPIAHPARVADLCLGGRVDLPPVQARGAWCWRAPLRASCDGASENWKI